MGCKQSGDSVDDFIGDFSSALGGSRDDFDDSTDKITNDSDNMSIECWNRWLKMRKNAVHCKPGANIEQELAAIVVFCCANRCNEAVLYTDVFTFNEYCKSKNHNISLIRAPVYLYKFVKQEKCVLFPSYFSGFFP